MLERTVLHFYRHTQRTPWDFCWKITIEKTIVKTAVIFLIIPFTAAENFGGWLFISENDFLFIVIVAPLVETLIFQTIPIGLARYLKKNFATQLFASMIPFAFAHFWFGIEKGICAGIFGGFYLAFTYAHWARDSLFKAFQITAGSHALGNAFLLIIAVVTNLIFKVA